MRFTAIHGWFALRRRHVLLLRADGRWRGRRCSWRGRELSPEHGDRRELDAQEGFRCHGFVRLVVVGFSRQRPTLLHFLLASRHSLGDSCG